MTIKGAGGSRQPGGTGGREERLAAELRENLKKRKDLVRKRADSSKSESRSGEASGVGSGGAGKAS